MMQTVFTVKGARLRPVAPGKVTVTFHPVTFTDPSTHPPTLTHVQTPCGKRASSTVEKLSMKTSSSIKNYFYRAIKLITAVSRPVLCMFFVTRSCTVNGVMNDCLNTWL